MTVATRTVKTLEDGVAALLTRKDLNSVNNLFGALERAFRTFLQKASIPEASTSQIVTLYDGVTDYAAVSPMFGSTVIDIQPVGQPRQNFDISKRVGIEDFDLNKQYAPSGYMISFETINGIRVMRIKSRFAPTRIVIDPMSATTGWATGGTASGLAQDKTFYYFNPASLRFTLTGAGSGYLEKTLTNSVDMTAYQGIGVGFLELELPTLNLTSVELRIGSDSSNYYAVTQTQGQMGAWTAGKFLDTPFDLSGATTVGSPDITKIKYVRLTFVTSGTITNLRCGYFSFSLPSQHEIFFTTSGIFKNATSGVISNYISDDTDIVLLDDAAYNIYEHECAITIGLQEGGTLASGIISTLNATLNGARAKNGAVLSLGLYDRFRADNPSEDLRKVGNWYD